MSLYAIRFSEEDLAQKRKVWEVLCKRFLQRFVKSGWRVLDFGGNCEFINNIECAEKYAIDLDPECLKSAKANVHTIRQSCTNLSNFQDGFFDLVFSSNIFEHLKSKEELEKTLKEVRRILRPDGRLLILGPNIRYCYKEYWDFFDHYIPLSHKSICEALMRNGFEVIELIPKFLPYTIKSRFPKSQALVRLYLMFPPIWRIFGKQMLVFAKPVKA